MLSPDLALRISNQKEFFFLLKNFAIKGCNYYFIYKTIEPFIIGRKSIIFDYSFLAFYFIKIIKRNKQIKTNFKEDKVYEKVKM